LTVIVGLVHRKRVHLAGDSAGVSGYRLTIRSDPKVFTNGPYVFGFTTSFRMGQLLHHAFNPPRPEGDLDRFMATTFIDAARTCLKGGGWARKEAEQEQAGTFLVGAHGRLFTVDSDYQVAEPADHYAAVGCGDELALGALHATKHLDLRPRERLTAALSAADHHSAGVAGPYAYAKEPRFAST
jgi:ATP-dependent protease HslVU (ClpYQ) peptidase subunit